MPPSFGSSRGQGLIEYLVLVALIAVASIGLVRVLQTSITAQLANVVTGLEGGKESTHHHGEHVTDDMLKKKDFGNFLNGAVSR